MAAEDVRVVPQEAMELLEVAPDAIHQNLLDKADAGAALVYAIYHHPRAVEFIKAFDTRGFIDAYGRAQEVYRVGRAY